MVGGSTGEPDALPWAVRMPGRVLISVAMAAAVALATSGLPRELRLILTFDTAAAVALILFWRLMTLASPAQTRMMGERFEPGGWAILWVTAVASVTGALAIGGMMDNLATAHWMVRSGHIGASFLALVLGWTLAQVAFAQQYLHMHFAPAAVASPTPTLHFPGEPEPDYWSFVYYSFTIAMCYSTSDVAILDPATRRLTLLHAVFSFFYVAIIIGVAISALSNLI